MWSLFQVTKEHLTVKRWKMICRILICSCLEIDLALRWKKREVYFHHTFKVYFNHAFIEGRIFCHVGLCLEECWHQHSMHIFGVIPFFKLRNNILTTVKRWKMRCRMIMCFWLICFVTFVCVWNNVSISTYRWYLAKRLCTGPVTFHVCPSPLSY